MAADSGKRHISLALQGGGSHGAFTWGVLDYLLETDRFVIDGISGTSAGAMNAAMLIDGYMEGGPERAREKLEAFWRQVSVASCFSIFRQTPVDRMFNGWNMPWSPGSWLMDWLSQTVSPYDFNPLNINPLRGVLESTLNLENLRSCRSIRLFVTATRVRDGLPRYFECGDITVEALLASACLPQIFQAVEIDGDAYWDGGYLGNPSLWPLVRHCGSRDVLIVQVNPMAREGTPKTAIDIVDRLNEITFNASLMAEVHSLETINRLLRAHKLSDDRYREIFLHLIPADDGLCGLQASSKLNGDWDFLLTLKARGREAAAAWLQAHEQDLGARSSLSIFPELP